MIWTWKTLASYVGADEAMLAIALMLIAAGFWSWWRPGAYLVPGVVLLWIALPSRVPFISGWRSDTRSRKDAAG